MCLNDGAEGVVVDMSRTITFPKGAEPKPREMLDLFEEKFGKPSVVFNPLTVGRLYNSKGVITRADSSCGKMLENNNNSWSARALWKTDTSQCSYLILFSIEQTNDHASRVTILIRDYARFEAILNDNAKQKVRKARESAPKIKL